MKVGYSYSQSHLGQLLLGQVQGVVERPDTKFAGVCPARQVCPQEAVVDHVDEGSDAVPAFIIEPDLKKRGRSQEAAAWASPLTPRSHLHVVFGVQTVDEPR